MDASNGHIPTGAVQVWNNRTYFLSNISVQGGFNESNDPLYIGRARHEDSFAVGKVRSEIFTIYHHIINR